MELPNLINTQSFAQGKTFANNYFNLRIYGKKILEQNSRFDTSIPQVETLTFSCNDLFAKFLQKCI